LKYAGYFSAILSKTTFILLNYLRADLLMEDVYFSDVFFATFCSIPAMILLQN